MRTIHRLSSQDALPDLIQSVRPAGLARDLANASPDDWNLIETIYTYPQLASLPFILFGAGQTSSLETGAGLTQFLVKPLMHLTCYRIQKARGLLLSTGSSIAPIARQVGFDDVPYFNRVFRKEVGRIPSAYRENSATHTKSKETHRNGHGTP